MAATASCVRMIRTSLNDFAQHVLRHFNALALPTQGNLAFSARWNILIDLNVTTGSFLKIIDGYTLGPNDSTHVMLCSKKYLRFLSTIGWARILIGLTASAIALVAAVVSATTTSTVGLVMPISTASGLHVLPIVGKIGIGWSRPPNTTTLYFVIHEHAQGLHGIHAGICH